jgi:homogentisate 1,2-dioxygenase
MCVLYFFSWLYRIRPSVMHEPFVPLEHSLLKSNFDESQDGIVVTPNQLRWKPTPLASGGQTDFIDGLITVSGSGSPALKVGMAVHLYSCDKSMPDRAFCNADGDMLIGRWAVLGSARL